MVSENDYKNELIEKLNLYHPSWLDGDLENKYSKTADIVNHVLKMAIEIKDDTIYQEQSPLEPGVIYSQTVDLSKKSTQWKDDAKDANKKFRNYDGYQTVLIVRTDMISRPSTVLYIMGGLQRFVKQENDLVRVGNKNVNLSNSSTTEIGTYLFVNDKNNYYFNNPTSSYSRTIELSVLLKMFGCAIKNLVEVGNR